MGVEEERVTSAAPNIQRCARVFQRRHIFVEFPISGMSACRVLTSDRLYSMELTGLLVILACSVLNFRYLFLV
jgi:hypothetical protein